MNLELLFDAPWWIPAMLAVVGIAAWASGNRRSDKALMRVGIAALVAAAAVLAVSYFVQTNKERAEAETRQFVQAVVEQDLETLRRILHPRSHVTIRNAGTPYSNRDEILAAISLLDSRFGLSAARVAEMQTEQAGPVITLSFTAVSEQQATMGRPLRSEWQFQFQETAEGWNLWTITALGVQGLGSEQVQREFPVLPRQR